MDTADDFICRVRISQTRIQQLQECSIDPMFPSLHQLVNILIVSPFCTHVSLGGDVTKEKEKQIILYPAKLLSGLYLYFQTMTYKFPKYSEQSFVSNLMLVWVENITCD